MGKITGLYQCPLCSASLTFRSAETRLIVCVCGKPLNRLDSDDLIPASPPAIQDHNDLIRPGAKGVIQGHSFEVLGRFRLWLEDSVVNYWTVLIEGKALCLLMEAYGMYALLRKITLDKAVSASLLDNAKDDEGIMLLQDQNYFFQRKDQCWKYEVEGEVWMPECNAEFPLFDFYARGDKHLSLIEFLPGMIIAYECRFTDFNALQLKGLNTAAPTPLSLTCTQCKTPIAIKSYPYAQSCSCTNCGSRLVFKESPARSAGGDFGGAAFRASGKDKLNQNSLALPLGAVGTLKGISYEVVGYALKQEDGTDPSAWSEYVLWNRAEGYAFLSEFAGNWIYVREKGDFPKIPFGDPRSFVYHGTKFLLYNKYQIRVVDTAGEFPYNAFDTNQAESAEFIAPPKMWIYEKSRKDGINWFLGEHLDRDELLEAFPGDLPDQTETGVLDPRGFGSMTPAGLLKVTLLAIGVLVLVHFLIGFTKDNRVLLDKDILLADSTSSTNFSSSKFELKKWSSNLQFDIEAPVDNSWLELQATLVNDRTGTEYGIDEVVQYYHGYDDGDSWDEGSRKETAYLNSIPAGTYFMRVQASRDTTTGGWNDMKQFRLTVTNDVSNDRNLWIFIGIILLYPIIQYIRMFIFERRRWEGSKYSPYNSKS